MLLKSSHNPDKSTYNAAKWVLSFCTAILTLGIIVILES